MKPYFTPIKDGIKVKQHILENNYKNVAICALVGLGDIGCLRHVFLELQKELPEIKFTFFVIESMEPLLHNSLPWKGEDCLKNFDIAYVLNYFMVEGSGSNIKKAAFCADKELGLDCKEFDILPFDLKTNRQVAIHFQGTALPGSTNPSEDVCKQIYDILLEKEYLPIEVHFEHVFHNPVNTKYPWIKTTVRGNKATVPSLFSVIKNSAFFIGCASGPLVMALSIYPNRVIYLKKDFDIKHYTSFPVKTVDTKNFNIEIFKNYLTEVAM